MVYINPSEIIRRIGQAPIGDPGAMNAQAARLRADADHLSHLVAHATSRANGTRYEGPAADRFRHEIADCMRDATVWIERLHEAASALQRAAGNVAASQARWNARFRQVEAELIAAARAAGRH
jgi:hypothetical protein